MTQAFEVTWEDYQKAADSLTTGQIRRVVVGENLHVFLSDGPVEIFCVLTPPLIIPFLTLYLARANRPASQKNSALLSSDGLSFVSLSTPWTESDSILTQLTTDVYISGGTIVMEPCIGVSTMTFTIVHPLAGPVGVYLKDYLIPPGVTSVIIKEAAKLLPAGLYLRAERKLKQLEDINKLWGVNFTCYCSEARK